MENIQNPTSTVSLIPELIKVIDAYRAREIKYEQLKDTIIYCRKNYPKYFFEAESLKKTIIVKLGKNRIEILNKVLNAED